MQMYKKKHIQIYKGREVSRFIMKETFMYRKQGRKQIYREIDEQRITGNEMQRDAGIMRY